MMQEIRVRHGRGDLYEIRVGDHLFFAVPPVEYVADDWPTRQEFFVAGVATFVAFYAERFLRRRGLPVEGLGIDCVFADDGSHPERLRSIALRVIPPAGVAEEEILMLLEAIRDGTSFDFLGYPLDVATSLKLADQAVMVP